MQCQTDLFLYLIISHNDIAQLFSDTSNKSEFSTFCQDFESVFNFFLVKNQQTDSAKKEHDSLQTKFIGSY